MLWRWPARALSLAACTLLLLAGCQRYTLHIHTEYVGIQDLASYHVCTPDPVLYNPPFGQRLMMSWKFPSRYLNDSSLHLEVTIRFCNREEKTLRVPIRKVRGMVIFPVLNRLYSETGGIRAYKVLLKADQGVYRQWKHHLWVDLITFEEEDEDDEDADCVEFEN